MIVLTRSLGYVEQWIFACMAVLFLTGCMAPHAYRADVDQKALAVISTTREQTLGTKGNFSVERPSDRLRTKLLESLDLTVSDPASLGTDYLDPIPHWPEKNYWENRVSQGGTQDQEADFMAFPLKLTLFQALEVGALNGSDYQGKKEAVFQAALALYLEQDSFKNSFIGQIQTLLRSDSTGNSSQTGSLTSGEGSGSRQFKNGMNLTTALALDLASLFTGKGSSSMGIAGDASMSIPLLRGAAGHIVTEPLRQAEQNLVYAILNFEQFKQEFAVSIAANYLSLFKQADTVKNTEEDYQSRIVSARRSKRLADAGRLKEIEVDQAVQTELLARQRWVSAREQYKKQLDSFKTLLGLSPDADIQLDTTADLLPAEKDNTKPGSMELSPRTAIELALANRLDIKVSQGRVYDAQRAVVVAADDLGAEFTFLGSASIGERRSITTADLANARLRTDKGVFSALITLDLPFERTAEAVTYRNSFLELAQAVRSLQDLEDSVKLSVQNRLRELLEARETLIIQERAVTLALKRVKSITLFMEAGRAETRDLLEAQDALLSAQNSFTSAKVNYRIGELEIQRDMGVLTVSDAGLWQEFLPEKKLNAEK